MPPPVLDYDPFSSALTKHAPNPDNPEDLGVDDGAHEDGSTREGTRQSLQEEATVAPIVSSYEAYRFTVLEPIRPGETVSWVRTRRNQIQRTSEENRRRARAYEKESGLKVIRQFQFLGPNQQAIVRRTVEEKNAAEQDRRAVWELFGVRRNYVEQRTESKTWKINNAIRVTLRRRDRKSGPVLDLPDISHPSSQVDRANTEDLSGPKSLSQESSVSTELPKGADNGHASTGVAYDPKLATSPMADRRDGEEHGDLCDVVNLRNVDDLPHDLTHLPQPVLDASEGRQSLDPLVHGDQEVQARPPFPPRGRRSVELDELRARETRNIEDVVRDEVRGAMREVAADDEVLHRWPTRSRSSSLRSARLASTEDIWSNAGSSDNRRFNYSTPGTSPDRGERYYPDRPTIHSRRRDSSGARPYVDDRKRYYMERDRYYMERDRDYVVRPHETYRERDREPMYPRDRRQGYDDYPPAHPRRRSRERQYDRPRVQRRVTDYPEAFHDADYGRLTGRGIDYERRVTDDSEAYHDADFGRRTGRGIDYERTRINERENRRRYAHEKQGETLNEASYMARDSDVDVDTVAKDTGVVASPSQTEEEHSVGEQQREPDVLTSLETTDTTEETDNSNEDVDQQDLDHAGSVSSPGFEVPANPNAEEEINSHVVGVEDYDLDYAESVFPQASMATRSGIDSPISDNSNLSRPISPSRSATGFGDLADPSRIIQPLPLRGASTLSAEHYISPETRSSPFEQSGNDQGLVSFESAFSTADLPGNVGALATIESTSFDIFGEHHQQALRRSRGTLLTNDFDDDDQSSYSCAESVFSQESTASTTATSLGGSLGSTSFLEMVNRATSALFAGDVVQSINSAALGDPGIGPERYRRNIRRMIKTFGKSLRAEADTFTERRVAVAMQTRRISTHVAHEIMTRVEGPRASDRRTEVLIEPMDEEQHSDTSTESADEDEVVLTQEPEDEAKIRDFVLDSSACVQFKKTLLNFVHRPYEKRIMTALNSSLDRTACHDKDYLVRVAREISWIPTNLFSFSQDRSFAKSDLIKGLIEDAMGESWNWSPLGERKHRLHANHCRLSWRTPGGRIKHVDLPEQVQVALRDAFNTVPAFVNIVITSRKNTTTASGKSAAGATSNSNPTIPLPSYQTGGGASSIPPVIPQIPLQPLGVASSNLQPRRPSIQGTADDHYIYLCVDAGTRSFIGVNCNGIQTDVEFFNKLRTEYNSARGWFRLWFSTWRYAHCDFWIFQQIALGGGARLEIGFPNPTDPMYHYLPKPLDTPQLPPHGPISHDEFNLHYYHQICPSLFSWERWHRRQIGLSVIEKGALEAAPKRIIKLDMQSGGREKFYGLYAKEARSALRVAIHMSVCCLPGVIFFFLWLYQLGHGADLQGAAVPVQLSLTLVAGYLGVLYWTR